jgi:hypothetical protein
MTNTIVLILFFLACSVHSSSNIYKDDMINQSIELTKDPTNAFKVDKNIINIIKNYYKNNYGEGARLEESISDTVIYMTYYNIPKNSDDYEGDLISITIPLINREDHSTPKPILFGDINNDRNSDLLISVQTYGGGGGGNIWWQDIFAFISENGNYKLACVTPDYEISGCAGSFIAEKILDNIVVGSSSCYGPDDPRCCPSEFYDVKVTFDNGKLKYRSKSKKK